MHHHEYCTYQTPHTGDPNEEMLSLYITSVVECSMKSSMVILWLIYIISENKQSLRKADRLLW